MAKRRRFITVAKGCFVICRRPIRRLAITRWWWKKDSLPDCLEMTAWTLKDDGSVDEVMGMRHKTLPIEGVQYHPESILSEHGHALLENFEARRAGGRGMNIQQALAKVVDHIDLSIEEMRDVMSQVMTGGATDAQIGALMMGLRMKSESLDEKSPVQLW